MTRLRYFLRMILLGALTVMAIGGTTSLCWSQQAYRSPDDAALALVDAVKAGRVHSLRSSGTMARTSSSPAMMSPMPKPASVFCPLMKPSIPSKPRATKARPSSLVRTTFRFQSRL